MMKTYLKRAFQLSDSGVKGLAKSIWSFFLYYVSFVPPMICVFLFADRLLNGNTGKPVVYLLFMLAATLVMYLVINYNYKTTYDETYQESANLRIDLAEQLSKLPLSYFSKHNLSDLAQTIMADVASIEHGFSGCESSIVFRKRFRRCYARAVFIQRRKNSCCRGRTAPDEPCRLQRYSSYGTIRWAKAATGHRRCAGCKEGTDTVRRADKRSGLSKYGACCAEHQCAGRSRKNAACYHP